MKVLAEVPEAQFSAARFGVSPDIRKDDFIYEYHLGPDQSRWETVRPGVVDYYCSDGARSAEQMDEPVARFHPDHGRRRLPRATTVCPGI